MVHKGPKPRWDGSGLIMYRNAETLLAWIHSKGLGLLLEKESGNVFSMTFYLLFCLSLKTLACLHSRLTHTLFQGRQTSTRFDSLPALFQHSCMRAAFMKLMPLFWPCCRIPSVLSRWLCSLSPTNRLESLSAQQKRCLLYSGMLAWHF